jgi:hypothetical protein
MHDSDLFEEITSYQQGMEEGKNRTFFLSASVSGNGNKVTTAIGQLFRQAKKSQSHLDGD